MSPVADADRRAVVILAFPGVLALDVVGPLEVFAMATHPSGSPRPNEAPQPRNHRGDRKMGTLVSTLFITLDGVVGGDKEMEVWHFPYFSDELGEAATGPYATADTILLGRVTYDSFAGAWPDRERAGDDDAEFARQLGDMRKVVVSNQPLDFTWRNSELLEGNLIEGVNALKTSSGGASIVMPGSVSVARQLLAANLVDEVHLMVHPIIARTGFKLFDEGDAPFPLELISSQALPKGVLNLVYAPVQTAT